MANPSPTSAVTRPDLRGTVYREWDVRGQRALYVQDRVMPQLDVEEPSATFKKIAREQYLDDVDTLRKGDGAYTQSEFAYTEANYSTVERGHKQRVDENARATVSRWFDAQVEAADIVLGKCWRDEEKRVADLLFNATTFSGHTAAINGVNWATLATADPINDVFIAKAAVKAASGLSANTLIIPEEAWDYMIRCDAVLDRLGAQSSRDAKIARRETVAQLLDLQQIVVAAGAKSTAKKGQTAALASIWNRDYVVVAYIDPAPRLKGPTLGVSYHWGGDGSTWDWTLEEYWDEDVRSWNIRARRQHKATVVDAACGYLLSTVLTK